MRFGPMICFLALLAAACAPVQLAQPFDPAQAAYAIKPGTGVIEGEAFVRKHNGRTVNAAGLEIYLFPVVPLTREMVTAVEAGQTIGDLPQGLGDYVRVEKADAKGRFKFEQVSAGEYYVFTRVPWTERINGETVNLAKRVFEHVQIAQGGRKKVTVSGSARQ
jgi:hypothetical protein